MTRIARTTYVVVSAFVGVAQCMAIGDDVARQNLEFFETEIRPLLAKHCYECHGRQDQPESGLRLTSRAAVLVGGESGPAVIPGQVDASLLIQAVRYRGIEMPPQGKLPPEQIKKIERWVELGLPWPEEESLPLDATGSDDDFRITDAQRAFWSFQPICAYEPPEVVNSNWPMNDVDRFVLARLESKGITPNPPADKRTLLRRVTYDLIGLPPTPQAVDNFIADTSPGAYKKVVDRLLESPKYGERWGRHWLDVVRYADTAGDVADYPVPQAYLYRDYVINAFNSDKPYDEFLREQLAGDLLAQAAPPEKFAELTTATGYIAITRRFGYNRDHQHHLTIADTLDTLGKSLLGLSLGCARCHDHKFDPISSSDYYALYGIFASTLYPFPGAEEQTQPRDFASLLPPAETAKAIADHERQIADLDRRLKELAEKKTLIDEQVKNASGEGRDLQPQLAQIAAELAAVGSQRNQLGATPPYPTAYAVAEGSPQDTPVHRRGDPERPGNVVPRRFLEILGGQVAPTGSGESGRRELAEWIISPSNPLTARVIVNRVWQHHFGQGLVRTPNDFGARGKAPTHPELLDFLALRFMREGWSLKALHRHLLLSTTYQMASLDRPDARSVDADNRLFWRMNPRRLDAECIRDGLLAVSGDLDESVGPPHPFPPTPTWTYNVHHPFKDDFPSQRRSIYLMTQRIQKHPFLGLFDGADPGATTDVRITTTTPTQALFMMNDPFVHEQSLAFAKRLQSVSLDETHQLHEAYELAFNRPPSEAEKQSAVTFLAAYSDALSRTGVAGAELRVKALAAYLRTILASNEFLFVD